MVEGQARLTLDGGTHALRPGSYAYLAPGAAWSLRNEAGESVRFHWVRKAFEPVQGLDRPTSFVTHESAWSP